MQKQLTTKRLILRPFSKSDIETVVELAGDRDVAKTTLNIPHPYTREDAENWISTHAEIYKQGEIIYAITLSATHEMAGAVSLSIKSAHNNAELGYWIGKKYWNKGYCTEASAAVIAYGFDTLNLNKIHAHHFENNHASGRVMKKIGMKQEGILRKHIIRWEQYYDIVCYGILHSDTRKR